MNRRDLLKGLSVMAFASVLRIAPPPRAIAYARFDLTLEEFIVNDIEKAIRRDIEANVLKGAGLIKPKGIIS